MEAQQDQEVTRRELIEAKSDIEALLKHPGWVKLKEYLQRNIDWRKNKVCYTPMGTAQPEGGVWTQEMSEFMKGELTGLAVILATPEQILENLKFDLAKEFLDGNESGE